MTAWRKLEEIGRPVDCLHCAPTVIEDLYEYLSLTPQRDFSPLTNLKILQPGGAELSPAILQRLVDLGVNVKTTYGSTEIGPPYRTIPCTNNLSCYKIRYLLPKDPHVQMEPQGEGLYECVVYKGFNLAAELWLDPQAPNPYRTNDLFIQDPPNSGLFVLQGRKDDMIVHSNGEKTNALPLQMAIEESHPAIYKVVVFGADKPCTSAVIELAKNINIDRDEIFAAIDKACEPFPSYSRLDRSFVLILAENETIPITPKGNVRRKEAQKLYGERLEILYINVLEGVQTAQEDDASVSLSDLDFLRDVVASTCNIPVNNIDEHTSFYTIGLDSQKAVRLRSKLAARFGKFPLMFIFEYPSVYALCERLSSPATKEHTSTNEKNIAWTENAISRYTTEITTWATDSSLTPADRSSGEIIYLTGATGALGNALLAAFATDPRVSKVYCAIRGSNSGARLSTSLHSRGYSAEIISSSKFITVPYNMTDAHLGLNPETYSHLSTEVTSIIHNAWKMDFNQQVDMFAPDCLHSTLALMWFAVRTTKKTFSFTSSVATNMGTAALGHQIPESPIPNMPALALETGYAQSKFVIEILSQTFASVLNVPVRIFRIGQLCGHSSLGAWNTTEMFPIMIASGLGALKAMPVLEQTVNWLPVDVCAESIRAVLLAGGNGDTQETSDEGYSLHNLVNPATVSWSQFLDSLQSASGVDFERVDMGEWVRRLQKASEEVLDTQDEADVVPGAKLLGFFEGMVKAPEGEAVFENEATQALVPRLRECRGVDKELLGLYLANWREVGFLRM